MEFTIRSANKTDMPQVLELINELAIYEKEPDAVEITVNDLENYGFGNQPAFHCFVAEADVPCSASSVSSFAPRKCR